MARERKALDLIQLSMSIAKAVHPFKSLDIMHYLEMLEMEFMSEVIIFQYGIVHSKRN